METKKDSSSKVKEGEVIGESRAKRLYRAEKNQMIAGVCAGLGEYLNLDPVIVRLIFVALGFGGIGVLLYLVLWLIVPTESSVKKISEETIKQNAEEIKEKAEKFSQDMQQDNTSARSWAGVIILGIGLVLLAQTFNIFQFLHINVWNLFIAFFFIYIGYRILNDRK